MEELSKKPLNVVFIGHVDHGKSTLIGRITVEKKTPQALSFMQKLKQIRGKEPVEYAHMFDQFSEEQRDGKTIDTTQVQIEHDGRCFNLIDGPGHLELLQNMVTGASKADAAILLIDAHEGMQTQTYKHLAIAGLLGCNHLIVVLNKMDLVKYGQTHFDLIKTSVERILKDSSFKTPQIIPICAQEGIGISTFKGKLPWYKGKTLLDALSSLPDDIPDEGPLRFPVQDRYFDGETNWLVGTILSGVLKVGQTVRKASSEISLTVSKIVSFPDEMGTASAGDSISVQLEKGGGDITAGDIICSVEDKLEISKTVSGMFVWLGKKPLMRSDKVTVRCASQLVKGQVVDIRGAGMRDTLDYGDLGKVEIKTESPVASDKYDNGHSGLTRLVMEQDGRIVSGGIAA